MDAEERSAYMRAYRIKHRRRLSAYGREYWKKHRDHLNSAYRTKYALDEEFRRREIERHAARRRSA